MEVKRLSVPPNAGGGDGWGGSLPLRADYPGAVELDLSDLRFATPTFLLRLRTFIDWHLAQRSVVVRAPTAAPLARYLARMHIAQGVPAGTITGLPAVTESDRADVLIAITRLNQLRQVDELVEGLARVVDAHTDDTVASVSSALLLGISELACNAVEHGKNATGCYVAAQRYGRPEGRLVLAIADLGIGIPEHLRGRYPELTADDQAIEAATEPATTGIDDSHRGYGISQLLEEIQGSTIRASKLTLRSGRGRVVARITQGSVSKSREAMAYKRGTWVALELGPGSRAA